MLRGLSGGSFTIKAALERFAALVASVRLQHFGRGASVRKKLSSGTGGLEGGGLSALVVNSHVPNLLQQLRKLFSLAAVAEACRFAPYVGQPAGTAEQQDAAACSQVLRREVLV